MNRIAIRTSNLTQNKNCFISSQNISMQKRFAQHKQERNREKEKEKYSTQSLKYYVYLLLYLFIAIRNISLRTKTHTHTSLNQHQKCVCVYLCVFKLVKLNNYKSNLHSSLKIEKVLTKTNRKHRLLLHVFASSSFLVLPYDISAMQCKLN